MEGDHRRRRRRPELRAGARSTRTSRCSGSGRSPGALRAPCSSAPRRRSARRTRASRPSGCSSAPRSPATCRATSIPRSPQLADRATYFYSPVGQVLVRPAGQHLAARQGPGRAPAHRGRLGRDRPAAREPGQAPAALRRRARLPRGQRPTSPTSTRRAWSSCTPSSPTSAASPTPSAMAFAQGRHRASRRGEPDVNRNMLVYLAADETASRSSTARCATTSAGRTSWPSEDDLDLTTEPAQPGDRAADDRPSETADARLLGAYHWALVPTGQPVEIRADQGRRPGRRRWPSASSAGSATTARSPSSRPPRRSATSSTRPPSQALGDRARDRRRAVEALRRSTPTCRGCATAAVLDAGLTRPQLLWEQEGFALADGYDEQAGSTAAWCCRRTGRHRDH